MKKFGKSKINYYDVTRYILHFVPKFVDVIGDVTDRLKKSEITFFLKQ